MGFATIFLATHPTDTSVTKARERLQSYTKVKQYQLQADRAYGWVFDKNGSLEDTFYLNSVAHNDPALDWLIAEMKLQPVGQRIPPIPPSARRSTKRVKKKKRKRR